MLPLIFGFILPAWAGEDDVFVPTDAEVAEQRKADDFTGAFEEESVDDTPFEMPVVAPPRKLPTVASGPVPIPLDLAGKAAFGDHFPIQVVHQVPGAVVLELPVVVAATRAEITAPLTVIGEVKVDGVTVTAIEQRVTVASAAAEGPTLVYLKVFAPIAAIHGVIEVTVSRRDGTEPVVMFRRTTDYAVD